VNIRALRGDGSWREEGSGLLGQVETARAANSVELWRDTIAVAAYRGREEAIADLIDYSCAVTARYLRTALADESYLNPTTLRDEYCRQPAPTSRVRR